MSDHLMNEVVQMYIVIGLDYLPFYTCTIAHRALSLSIKHLQLYICTLKLTKTLYIFTPAHKLSVSQLIPEIITRSSGRIWRQTKSIKFNAGLGMESIQISSYSLLIISLHTSNYIIHYNKIVELYSKFMYDDYMNFHKRYLALVLWLWTIKTMLVAIYLHTSIHRDIISSFQLLSKLFRFSKKLV
jgi:hypothetical protein